jgi:hypothetical protein
VRIIPFFRRRGRHHGRATFPHVPSQRRRRVPWGTLAALLALAVIAVVLIVAGVTR